MAWNILNHIGSINHFWIPWNCKKNYRYFCNSRVSKYDSNIVKYGAISVKTINIIIDFYPTDSKRCYKQYENNQTKLSVCSLKKLKLRLNIYLSSILTCLIYNDVFVQYTMSTLLFSINFANANFLFIAIAKQFVIASSLRLNDTFPFAILPVNLICTGERQSVIRDIVLQMLHITISSSETNSCLQFEHIVSGLNIFISIGQIRTRIR